MDVNKIAAWLKQISKALLIIVIFGLVIPLLFGAIAGVSQGRVLSLVFSTLILQATAVAVGVAAGLQPVLVLMIMTSFAFGMVLAIYEILDSLYNQSQWVQNKVNAIEERAKKFTFLSKYGIYSLIFISWLPGLGLYACPVIAWMVRWEKKKSVALITLGFFLAAVGVLLGAVGLFRIVT